MMRASKVVSVFIAYSLFKLRGLRSSRNPPLTPPRRGTQTRGLLLRRGSAWTSDARFLLPSCGGGGGGFPTLAVPIAASRFPSFCHGRQNIHDLRQRPFSRIRQRIAPAIEHVGTGQLQRVADEMVRGE